MNWLVIGDPHFKITRFEQACQFLKWVEELVSTHKPDAVVYLGDAFDTHAVLRSELLTTFDQHINDILINTGHVYYVLGNHDCFKPDDSRYHALQTFETMPGRKLTVISETMSIDKYDMTFVPYTVKHSDFPTDINKICFCHQTFLGADYGHMRPEDGVEPGDVSSDIIISGHIHGRQVVAGKVIYPGTPYPQSLNDLDETKGVMLFDTQTFKQTFIESPFPAWRSLKYILSQSRTIDDVHADVVANINEKDNWIIDLTGNKPEIIAYMDSKQYKELCKKFSVQINTRYSDREKKKEEITAISMEDIVSQYYDIVYKGSLDKNELVDKAVSILGKVNTGT